MKHHINEDIANMVNNDRLKSSRIAGELKILQNCLTNNLDNRLKKQNVNIDHSINLKILNN